MQSTKKKDKGAAIPEKYKGLADAQEVAADLIQRHLAKPLKEIQAKGYSRTELATAYLMLAYHALRHNKPKDKAEEAFDILAYFAKRRIESGMERKRKKKLSRLH